MSAFIEPPKRIPVLLKLGIRLSQKITGKELLIGKLLSWYPKAALSSAVMESLVAHHDREIDARILKLVRIQASFSTACPFCMDMNSFEYEKYKITEQEFSALKKQESLMEINSLNDREKLAVNFTRLISQTPILIPDEFIQSLKTLFNEREIVILATTAAQVNYWARLCSALGVPPAGFTETCKLE